MRLLHAELNRGKPITAERRPSWAAPCVPDAEAVSSSGTLLNYGLVASRNGLGDILVQESTSLESLSVSLGFGVAFLSLVALTYKTRRTPSHRVPRRPGEDTRGLTHRRPTPSSPPKHGFPRGVRIPPRGTCWALQGYAGGNSRKTK